MRRRFLSLTVALLLSLTLMTPALAWSEYGVIYDETELLWSEELERLGTEVLPGITEKYDIDMRVDILTSISGYDNDLPTAAAGIYEDYGYGSASSGNGVTLTLLVHEDEDGVALDGWHPYAAGESWELTANATWNICRNSDTWLSEEAWSGDLEQDIEALTGAVTDMAEGLESFVLAGGVHSTIWSPVTQSLVAEEEIPKETDAPVPQETPASESEEAPVATSQINNITDVAGLLTESEWGTLERLARTLSEEYSFGVYAIAVDDYEDYAYGDVQDAAEALYHGYDLGAGADRDGVLLLLSMYGRDYGLIANGDFGDYAFNEEGCEALTAFFLDDFADDDWYGGFSDYLTWCGNYLEAAQNGEPFSADNPPMDAAGRMSAILIRVAVILLLPLIIAFIVILILGSKMRSVAAATQAKRYIKGNLILTGQHDRYTHTTQTRQKVTSESGNSKSSGGGTSGKF